jgi:hypothetical protein
VPSDLLLTDRTANTGIVVTPYETLADLEVSEANRQQQLANLNVAVLLEGTPVTEVCEVPVRVA